MKKQLGISLTCLFLAVFLVACGGNQPEDYEKQIWTNEELAKVKGDKTPQENGCLVVALQQDEADQKNVDDAGNGLIQLVDGLHALHISGTSSEDALAGYRKTFEALEMEDFPFQIVANPHDADIKLEYELEYPSAGKFAVSGQSVEALGCKLKLKAYRVSSGEELASVEVTNAPSSASDLPKDAQGEVKMAPPDLSKAAYSEKMLKFFREINNR